MTPLEIQAEIKKLTHLIKGDLPPSMLVEIRTDLSRLYATLEGTTSLIEQRFPAVWLSIRETTKTDKEANIRYDMTQDGQDKIALKATQKGLEKILSALNQQIAVKRDEAKNTY